MIDDLTRIGNQMVTNPRHSARRCRGRADAARLAERAARARRALIEERWLPIGLRSLLGSELPGIEQRLRSGGRRGWRQAAQRVHELAWVSFVYGSEARDSEAVAQLRVLDLELNPPKGLWGSVRSRGSGLAEAEDGFFDRRSLSSEKAEAEWSCRQNA